MAISDSTSTEVWKDISRLPGYQASSHGLIRTFWKRINTQRGGTRILVDRPRILRPLLSSRGYHTIRAYDSEMVHRTCQVHRLVLETFVGPCPDGHEGCHRNGNRTENYLDNLYWATRARNCVDTRRHGRHPKAILSLAQLDEAVRLHYEGMKQREIAARLGVRQPAVSCALLNRGYRRARRNFTPKEVEEIAELRRKRTPLASIAAQFGTTPKSLDDLLRRTFGSARL
jgi:hypothetical protein